MEKEPTTSSRKLITKENGKTIRKQAMGFVNIMMEVYENYRNRNMKASGRTIKCMVKGLIDGEAENMLVNISKG